MAEAAGLAPRRRARPSPRRLQSISPASEFSLIEGLCIGRPQSSPLASWSQETGQGAGSTPFSPRHEGQPLEQVHILLVLEQRPVQRRDQLLGVALAQDFGLDV